MRILGLLLILLSLPGAADPLIDINDPLTVDTLVRKLEDEKLRLKQVLTSPRYGANNGALAYDALVDIVLAARGTPYAQHVALVKTYSPLHLHLRFQTPDVNRQRDARAAYYYYVDWFLPFWLEEDPPAAQALELHDVWRQANILAEKRRDLLMYSLKTTTNADEFRGALHRYLGSGGETTRLADAKEMAKAIFLFFEKSQTLGQGLYLSTMLFDATRIGELDVRAVLSEMTAILLYESDTLTVNQVRHIAQGLKDPNSSSFFRDEFEGVNQNTVTEFHTAFFAVVERKPELLEVAENYGGFKELKKQCQSTRVTEISVAYRLQTDRLKCAAQVAAAFQRMP